jgi:hypothetical protein
MKTKLFIISLFFISLLNPSIYAQDTRLSLGGGWLRWDSDSSMFKFSNSVGRENNLPLFKFNPDQFVWNLSTGLNLKNTPGDTNISLKRFTIYRDTIVNENFKSRSYTFIKPYYAHQYDLFDIVVNYQSNDNGTITENKNINLFNNCYTIYDNQDLNYRLNENPFSTGWTFSNMIKGQYLIIINYQFEFEKSDLKSDETLDAVLLNLDNSLEYAHNTHTFSHTGNLMGQISTGSISCVITPSNAENKNINLTFQGNSLNSLRIFLNKLRILAILIN